MSLVDDRGRLFGRFNLIDAATVIVVLALLPIGYGTYLLFRPSQPRIDSVSQVDLTREELRIANGATIAAKLKVRGSGFNPLLRAFIGETPALAFVYENPNSADVVVGETPAGSYDLVLYDGVQQVARAAGAVNIKHEGATAVRAVGRLMGLDPAAAKQLQPGYKSPADARGAFEVVAIGAAQPAVSTFTMGTRSVDVPLAGVLQYPAVLLIRCDTVGSACSIGGVPLNTEPPIQLALPGGYAFMLDELLPTTAAAKVRIEVDLAGSRLVIKPGDRDALLDERAAVVTGVAGGRVTIELGADRSRDGWSYRGRRLRAGAPFLLQTDRYELKGTILSVTVDAP